MIDDGSPEATAFWEIVFANWSFEELTVLTVGADAWSPRDPFSRRV